MNAKCQQAADISEEILWCTLKLLVSNWHTVFED